MSRKRKRGRPFLPEGAAKAEQLCCRLSPSEGAEIEAAAKRAKKTKSKWIRGVLLAASRESKPPKEQAK